MPCANTALARARLDTRLVRSTTQSAVIVRSTTQSAVISSRASSQAGVAAAVGEIAKDNQYQDIVNDNGGDFIPLVCETFGVWSPYAQDLWPYQF